MIIPYLPYIILLLISPVLGMYSLRFVYPDIKTYLKRRRWMLFVIFGLAAYVPSAIISLSEFLVPLYSPLGANPVFFESEGSAIFTLVLFLGVLIVNTSVVEFVMVRHRETRVVGIPKHVIKYSINREIVKSKKNRREREISKITKDLEGVAKEEMEIKPLLEKIRISVVKEREMRGVGAAEEIHVPEVISTKEIRPPEEVKQEREELLMELEAKLKTATKDVQKREKSEELLDRLKEKITEEEPKGRGRDDAYQKEDIAEITQALKNMKLGKVEEKEEKPVHRHGMTHGKKAEEEIGESLASHAKTHRRGGEDDILKDVVGDVRQQLIEPKEAEEGEGETEEAGEKRWYDKGPKPGEPEVPQAEPGVEMFEPDLSFGDELGGDLGGLEDFGDEFGDLSDLEGLNQDLDSGDFDGMFVDVGDTKGGCPNCGKKGTSVVYCSSCGKPLCSNCAASVEGSEDYVKYKCPHCQEEFAMKRRMPA